MLHRLFLIIASLVLLLDGCTSSPASLDKPRKVVQQTRLSYRVLPFRIEASYVSYDTLSRQLSPNGRYTAYFTKPKGNRERLLVYNFATSSISTFDVGHLEKNISHVERYVVWRQDSRACAVVASSGIAVIWPADKKIRWISREAPTFDSCLAWAPRSHRLAIFQGDFVGNSYFRVWNGRRIVSRLDWQKAVGTNRTQYETSAMQAEWSPDEQSIVLRFEARSGISGTLTNAMDMVVLDAKTGRARWMWKNRAGPVLWLDNSRLVFQDFDEHNSPKSLVVARPKTKQHGEWLGNIVSWTPSAHHDTFWAITDQGHLYKSPAQKRQWILVKRGVGQREISMSAQNDVVALSHSTDNPDQWHLALFSPATGQVWRWQGSGKFQIIGWAKGQQFPLVAFRPNTEFGGAESWQVWQFRASK